MNKRVLIGGAVAIAILAVVLWLKSDASAPASPNSAPLGSVASPDLATSYSSVNGVTTWVLRQNMRAATTSLCSFPNPAGLASTTNDNAGVVGMATSSLVSFALNITTGTGTAAFLDLATSTSQYATSTRTFFYGLSVPANNQAYRFFDFGGMATSSDVKLNANMPLDQLTRQEVRPGEFVNLKTQGAGSGGYTYSGQCIAVFRSLSAF